jgi:hypothetical protein
MRGPIECTISLYSGRRDPRLDLSDEEWAELRRRMDAAGREPRSERSEPPYLGFRGFRIFNPEGEPGLPYQAEVFGGFITVTQRNASRGESLEPERHFADTAGLEGWLMERATKQGFGKDIDAVRRKR